MCWMLYTSFWWNLSQRFHASLQLSFSLDVIAYLCKILFAVPECTFLLSDKNPFSGAFQTPFGQWSKNWASESTRWCWTKRISIPKSKMERERENSRRKRIKVNELRIRVLHEIAYLPIHILYVLQYVDADSDTYALQICNVILLESKSSSCLK